MKRILSCSCLALISACKTTTSVPMQTATVKPSALIGTAYDAITQEFTGVSCLDLSGLSAQDYEMRPLTDFSVDVRDGTRPQDLEAVFGSFQKSFYTFATGLRLSRPYETVQRILEGDRDVVRLLVVQSDAGGLRFKPESRTKLRLSRDAQTMVQHLMIATGEERRQLLDSFLQTCGSGFLAGTRYSLGMAATLRWTFPSVEAKRVWSSELRSQDAEALADGSPSIPAVRLRYESFMKETREVSLKSLGETGSKDCAPEAAGPCLDAWRLFQNATVPAWQTRLKKFKDDFDSVLPQAFLFEPEVVPYQDIEPALAGIRLEPDAVQAKAWREARERFVNLYAAVYRRVQEHERAGALDQVQKLQAFLQEIATDVAACYRPALNLDLCVKHAVRLEAELSQPR